MNPRPTRFCDPGCVTPSGIRAMIDDATIESAIRQAHRGPPAGHVPGNTEGARAAAPGAVRSLRTALLPAVLALTALFGLAAGPGVRAQGDLESYGLDRAITADVKKRFAGNRDVDAATIRVETLNGVVVLHGYASSDAARTEAAVTAWRVEGVKRVRNEISVRP